MVDQVITNPAGSLRTVSDFRTMRDDSGEEVSVGKTTRKIRANAAINAGQCVALVVPTETVPLSVGVATGSSGSLFYGVAAETADGAGVYIDVVTEGLAFAIVGTGGVSAGAELSVGASGTVVASSTPDPGDIAGVALAAASATDVVPVIVKHL